MRKRLYAAAAGLAAVLVAFVGGIAFAQAFFQTPISGSVSLAMPHDDGVHWWPAAGEPQATPSGDVSCDAEFIGDTLVIEMHAESTPASCQYTAGMISFEGDVCIDDFDFTPALVGWSQSVSPHTIDDSGESLVVFSLNVQEHAEPISESISGQVITGDCE